MSRIQHAFTTPYMHLTMVDNLIIVAVILCLCLPFWGFMAWLKRGKK